MCHECAAHATTYVHIGEAAELLDVARTPTLRRPGRGACCHGSGLLALRPPVAVVAERRRWQVDRQGTQPHAYRPSRTPHTPEPDSPLVPAGCPPFLPPALPSFLPSFLPSSRPPRISRLGGAAAARSRIGGRQRGVEATATQPSLLPTPAQVGGERGPPEIERAAAGGAVRSRRTANHPGQQLRMKRMGMSIHTIYKLRDNTTCGPSCE